MQTLSKTTIRRRNYSQLYHACKNGDLMTIVNLFENNKLSVNRRYYKTHTLLHIAVRHNYLEIIDYLLQIPNIHLNLQSYCGYTALHYSINANPLINSRDSNINVIRLLLNHPEIDVNIGCNGGTTPLLLAIDNNNIDAVKILLADERIDINQEDSMGITPIVIAYDLGHEEIINLLLNDKRLELVGLDAIEEKTLDSCSHLLEVKAEECYNKVSDNMRDLFYMIDHHSDSDTLDNI
jgi:ankyrin repeat protein